MESKLRHLVMKLEQIETIKLAHPFNRGFDKVHFCATEEEGISVAHGEIRSVGIHDGVKTAETDLKDQNGDSESKEEGDSKVKVYTTTYYIGLEINSGKPILMKITVCRGSTHLLQKFLSRSIFLGLVWNSMTCARARSTIMLRNRVLILP